MKEILKEAFTNPWIWSVIGGLVCLILPSPMLKKAGDKAGDALEEVAGEKVRDIAYKILIDFAKGLKNSKHDGDINLTSNDQIDNELDKYKVSLGLKGSKSKVRE